VSPGQYHISAPPQKRRSQGTLIMTESTPATKGLVLHSHARYYDFVARLLTLGHGDTLHERLVELARLAPYEAVLDVGCGTGSLALAAKARVGAGGTVHGIDASKEMIEQASRKAQRRRVPVDFRIATVEALPFPDRSFDVVFSTLMLHHLPRPLRRACASEIARVLKPGGRVLMADFLAPARRRRGWLAHLHRHGSVKVEEVHELLVRTGFRVLESRDVGVGDLHFTLATWEGNR
jgi:Methylase involved in ubiquinone/menaquinone biosynthesis